jgi:heme/copper-type cytochrome/quinol oxidase subunit 2
VNPILIQRGNKLKLLYDCKENKRKVFQTYDLPLYGQTTLQDPSTKVAMEIVRLNQTVNFYLILILSFVTWIAFVGFLLSYFMLDNAEEDTVVFWKTQIMSLLQRRDQTVLELVWTLVPAIVLVLLAIPSFTLLYQAEEKSIDYKSISVVGHQWYWEYFYPVPKTTKSNLTWYNNITSIDTYVKLTALIADYRYDSLAPR